MTAIDGDNTITYGTLADGTYSDCTITVTDATGNTSDALTVNTFEINTVTPILTEVTPVPTPADDTTPSYTFNSSKAGTIAYAGSCGSTPLMNAIVGNNTITYGTLTDGTYSGCTITVTDATGNTSPVLTVNTFVIDTLPDWLTVSDDDNIYTVGDSSVTVDSSLFAITVENDSVIFEENGSDPKVYIRLMSNGEVFTGYIEGTIENPTVDSGFAPGTKVSVGADMILLIETPLTGDLTLGGK